MRISLIVAGVLTTALVAAPPAAADHTVAIVAFDAATSYGDAVTLAARLVDPSDFCPSAPCPVIGRQVDFYVDGAYVGTDVTNSGGYAYLLLTAAPSWHAGAHDVRVQYDRASGGAATDAATLTISPEATVLAVRDGYLEARLTDDDGAALAGFAVAFYATSPLGTHDLCTAFTDGTGLARCSGQVGAGATPLDALTYGATFAGTRDYVGSGGRANLL